VAPPAGTLRVGRYFLSLVAILAILYGLVYLPGHSHKPKLGLDLEGGTQVIFKARTPTGKAPSKTSMNEARTIMENRVNGYGVANAEVVVQGNDRIQISVPGKSASDIANIGSAAVLNFRPLVMAPVPTQALQDQASASASASSSAAASKSATGSATPTTSTGPSTPAASAVPQTSSSSTHSTSNLDAAPLGADTPTPTASPTPTATPTGSGSATPTGSSTATATPTGSAGATSADPLVNLGFAVPQTEDAYAKLTAAQQTALQTALAKFDCGSKPVDDTKAKTYLACDSTDPKKATYVYLLGPVVVPGTEIGSASALAPGTQQGQTQWVVSLHLKSSGQASWANWTSKHNTDNQTPSGSITSCGTGADPTTGTAATPCADYVAFTLDAAVINAPYTGSTINGDTQISGGFTQKSATDLANQLKYGALPLSFDTETNSTVSATLGSGQLKAGLLAGGIGLILVVLYSLIYYRALGLVTITSLLVSGALTWAMLVILGREIGFTLTLAGIAGFIVAVGITADSFVVFFERIKDEVHEGRSMRVAVPRAWVRARRTILSADTVSFLAAAILYYFAAGDVRGFAFTLGLSTILDLVVVFLFTHPLVSWLSRSAAFGSARFTGLDSAREGGVNKGAEAPIRTRGARRSATAVLQRDAEPETDVLGSEFARPPVDNVNPIDVNFTDFGTEIKDLNAANGSTTPVLEHATESFVDGAAAVPEPVSVVEGETAAERAAARRARLRGKALTPKPAAESDPTTDAADETDDETDGPIS
jgi:preprotein translocase subunit SecD